MEESGTPDGFLWGRQRGVRSQQNERTHEMLPGTLQVGQGENDAQS